MQDEQMVERVLQGDQEMYRVLVERHRKTLYGLVYGVLRHPKDAEDALQEAFVRIYLSLPQFKQQNFKAWIGRIAVNCAIDLHRSRQRKQSLVTLAAGTQELSGAGGIGGAGELRRHSGTDQGDDWIHAGSGSSPPAEEEALSRERKERVHAMVGAMPEGYGNVVRAYYLEEKSQREIAEAENIEVKSVESRLYRAKQWMRKHWKEEDLT